MIRLKKLFARLLVLLPVLFVSFFYSISSASSAPTPTLFGCYSSLGRSFPTVQERAIEAAKFGIWQYKGTAEQNKALRDALCPGNEGDLGFSVVTDYQKAVSSQMTATQDFVPVTSLTLKDGTALTMSDLGVRVFLTLEPGATKEEIVMCTGIDSTLTRFTSCTRGLAFKGTTTTAVTANQKTHAGGSVVVISNVHYVYDQFLDRTGRDQDIAGIKTFTSSTLQIGDSTTSSSKYLKFLVGQGSEPYFRVVGPGAGASTSTIYFSLDGTSDLQLNASGTTFAVSSTRSTFITDGLIGINASGTTGLAFDSNGTLYHNVSTTQGLSLVDGQLRFNQGANIVFTGNIQVQTPTSTLDAGNKGYIDLVSSPIYGDASDGDVTIVSPTTLTRDMYYDELFLTGTNDINTAGYKVFANVITRASTSTAKFTNNGGAGGVGGDATASAGAAGTAGAAGAASAGNTLPPGTAGVIGVDGILVTATASSTAGRVGTAGTAKTDTIISSNGSAGATGGQGGGSSAGGAGGAGGTATQTKHMPRSSLTVSFGFSKGATWTVTVPNAGSGSGGSGGVTVNDVQDGASGGSGGSGGGGGVVFVASKKIVDLGSGTMFEAIGGAGGAGGASTSAIADETVVHAGGSGGGAGGVGGLVLRISGSITGAATTSVLGGAGGASGAKYGNNATNAATAASGAAGLVIDLVPSN